MAITQPQIPDGSIFQFHRVLPENAPAHAPGWTLSLPIFEKFIDRLQSERRIVPLEQLIQPTERTGNGSTSADCALVFLDGWADSFHHAWPILRKHRIPATIFLPVRLIGSQHRPWMERMWTCLNAATYNGAAKDGTALLPLAWLRCSRFFPWMAERTPQEWRYRSLAQFLLRRSTAEAEEFVARLETEMAALRSPGGEDITPAAVPAMLSWEQAECMARDGIVFGSQTLHHALLTRLPPSQLRMEIAGSRQELQERLQQPVAGFAYPWGSHAPWIQREVQSAGYEWALAGTGSSASPATARFALPAVPITNHTVSRRKAKETSPGSRWRVFSPQWFGSSRHRQQPRWQTSFCQHSGPTQERIRIAFIIDVLENWKGGTEQQLCKIIHGLDLDYFDPVLYVFSPSAAQIEADVPCPVVFLSTGTPGQWPRKSVLSALTAELRRIQPHIVQTFFRDGNYYGTFAARLAGVPIVINTWRNLGYWITPLDRFLLMMNERFVDEWQCNSRAIESYLKGQRGIPADHIEILPNALDISRFQQADAAQKRTARDRLQLPLDVPVFVAVSNLRPVKDLITLVHASALLRREMPNARVLILGDGPLREPLQSAIEELNLEAMVHLVPAQSDVRPYLWAADAGILTSRNEGLSNVVLEYMAAGLPTLLSDIEANRELAAGHFFRTGDPQDLCRQLVHLCHTPSLMQDVVSNNRAIVDQFSLPRFTSRLQSHYTGLIAGLPELPDE